MNNFFIVTPTFNDWRSLNEVLYEIDKKVSKMNSKIVQNLIKIGQVSMATKIYFLTKY